MARNIGGFVVGFITFGLVVVSLQQLSSTIYPIPEGLDPFDPAQAEAFARHLEGMPMSAWLIAMLSEVVGAFCGAFMAGWIATSHERLLSGGMILMGLMGSIYNWTQFTHPIWFIVCQIVLYGVAVWGVWTLLEKKGPPAAAEGPAT